MLNDGNVNGVLSKFDVSIDLYCLFCLDYFMLKPLLHHYLSLLLVLSIKAADYYITNYFIYN